MDNGGEEDGLVIVEYSRLQDPASDLSAEIEAAFGTSSLGVIAVRNVPGCQKEREELLPLAERLGQLPEASKQALEDPESSFSFGWSFGREALENGKPDTHKGSFYANPMVDAPTSDPDLIQKYPSYCRPNVWPTADLPLLEPALKQLGGTIVGVGMKLVEHCDRYVSEKAKESNPDHRGGCLTAALARSLCHKARLLLYMPSGERKDELVGAEASVGGADVEASNPLWCNWHLDHGSLTGLTRAMYLEAGKAVATSDPGSGLFIRKQDGTEVQVAIPEDCIAFQMGQSMSIMSGGLLCATPHAVKAPKTNSASGVSRSTFAVFMQPMWNEPLCPTAEFNPSEKTRRTWGPWSDGITFGEFSERVIGGYYGKS